jgi:hypothetical protein
MQVLQLQSDEQRLYFEKRRIEDSLSYEQMIGIDCEAKSSKSLEELKKVENQYKEIQNQIAVKMEEMRKIAKEDAELKKKEQEERLLRQQRKRVAKLEQLLEQLIQTSEVQMAEAITEEVTELEQPDQIRDVQTAKEVTEEVTKLEQPIQIRKVVVKVDEFKVEQEEDGKEEEEDKLQRRLWEEKGVSPQTAEIMMINQEPPVLVMVPNLASTCDVATLFCEVHSPHHLGKFHDQQFREVCQGIVRRQNQEKWCHKILRTISRKVKQKNNRRNHSRKKVKVSWGLRFGSEAQIYKQRRSYQRQQSSNPYRKEVRDEGGTGKVDPLG